jgi:hypothetical protein
VLLVREHYGRGPLRAKTYVLDNLIACGLSDGFNAASMPGLARRARARRVWSAYSEIGADFERLVARTEVSDDYNANCGLLLV